MSRKIAREMSFQILYQLDFHDENVNDQIEDFINNIKTEKQHNDKPLNSISDSDIEFVKHEVNGILTNSEMINKTIEEYSIDWNLGRIAKVDLAILRLAVFEILFEPDIPKEVSINEAVELAKKYSTEDAKKFINGILGKVVG